MIHRYDQFGLPRDRPLNSTELDVGFQIVSSNKKCGEVKIPSNPRFHQSTDLLELNSDYKVIACFQIHYLCGFDIEALTGWDFQNLIT